MCACVCVCVCVCVCALYVFPITSVQLTLDRTVNNNPGESLNGYMVAPREDTGTLGADVPYVGSWVLLGADQKHVCGNVSTAIATLTALLYKHCRMHYSGKGMKPARILFANGMDNTALQFHSAVSRVLYDLYGTLTSNFSSHLNVRRGM